MEKKFYGLIIPKKSNKIGQKSKSIFDDSDEEDEKTKKENMFKISSAKMSKQAAVQKKLEQEDPTIYEYDNIYDSLKQKQTEKQIETKKQGPKYINNLLKAADKRKKEQERRQERKIQTEREKEGDEFKDKESFVTSAYKQKMLDLQAEEEREKLQDQIDDMMDVTKQKDLSGFYRHYLKQAVGEEKVPEFGEREAKIKELSEQMKKRHNSDNSDNESEVEKNLESPKINTVSNEDADDDFLSSDDSDNAGDRDNKDNNSEDHDDKSDNSEDSDDKSDTSKCNFNQNSKRPTVNSSSTRKKLKTVHSNYTLEEHYKIDSDSNSSVQESFCKQNDNGEKNISPVKTKPDMKVKFQKRTVDEVFDRAQARYFERVAARKL